MARILTVDDIEMIYPSCFGCQGGSIPPEAPEIPEIPEIPDPPTFLGGGQGGFLLPVFTTILISYDGFYLRVEDATGEFQSITLSGTQIYTRTTDHLFFPGIDLFSVVNNSTVQIDPFFSSTGSARIEGSPEAYEVDVMSRLDSFPLVNAQSTFRIQLPVEADGLITSAPVTLQAGGSAFGDFLSSTQGGYSTTSLLRGTVSLA